MKKPKHTPGPWGKFPKEVMVFTMELVLPNEATILLDRMSRFDDKIACSKEEMEANAKLIAAAPEMLESLKALKEILEGDGLIDAGDMRRIVNSAITKALGE